MKVPALSVGHAMPGTSQPSLNHPARRTSRLGWLALLPFGILVACLSLVRAPLPIDLVEPWVPSLGVELAFRIDGLSLLMLVLITGVGAAVFLYAAGYMAEDPKRRRLFGLLVFFMLAMIGCVTASNLLLLFVFWELTSITSFLLVGYKHEYEASRKSAQQALLVTGTGGLILLVGIILLGQAAGTYAIPEFVATAPRWRDHPQVTAGLLCVLLGAFTKSAQFPFHFWLPNAMAAPTPVSAYLHSATMVKLGVYLLARLHPAFSPMTLWQLSLVSAGAFTSVWAMVHTVRERDLKRILAWSTVAALGTLVMVIGLPGEGAATAAAAFLLAHALYKAPLFFVAGNIDIATGTRDIDELPALAPRMPVTAAAALMAATSMAGLPLSFGFVAKDIIKLAKAEADVYTWVAWSGVFVGAVSVAAAGVAAIRVFWHGNRNVLAPSVREVPWTMLAPALTIGALGIVLGLAPWLAQPLIAASAVAMHPESVLSMIDVTPDSQGWGAVALTGALGATIFRFWDRLHVAQARVLRRHLLSSVVLYETFVSWIPKVAGASTRWLQHGRVVGYVELTLAGILVPLAVATWVYAEPVWPAFATPSVPVVGATIALMVAAAAVCVVHDSFVLLLSSGLAGLASAVLFVFAGAPDVAFTQFAVEVAFVVVIASALLRVRRIDRNEDETLLRCARAPRAILALGAGALVAALTALAVAGSSDPALTRYFSELSVPQAHGRNVVNVILVDFRAVDTLGEISVVFVTFLATLPLFSLLQRGHRRTS
jgi:multicomponent Na+:H+ antiporter subunit A